MKTRHLPSILALMATLALPATAGALKAHGIFSSNMVLQRQKPITIWGWAAAGSKVSVKLGVEEREVVAAGDKGRWQAEFPPREANGEPLQLLIRSGEEAVSMDNIVMGDVWVMNGQSNMAFGLGKTQEADLELPQANLPLLREIKIDPNEKAELQTDLDAAALPNGGWVVSSPRTAGGFSAIGYAFASHLQRSLGIPIGIIDNARGGASIESLVPHHKFDDHPVAKRYAESVAKRAAEFNAEAHALVKWERTLQRMKGKGVPEDKWPKKPVGAEGLTSWDIPGQSPSDAASCYNGMFGVFKGLQIKGVLFHQGYNNAISGNCRPQRYRVLMKLMIEGWREDFNDPHLPVGVIEFCAGGIAQTDDNFETWSTGGAAYIREAQRLGVADLKDPDFTAFIPGYDIQIPGLHPIKKQAHGVRAARWALHKIYQTKVGWCSASLVSAEPKGDEMVLTFDQPVMPDNLAMVPEGFSIAGEDGKYYRAHARFRMKEAAGNWNTPNKNCDASIIHVWSPLVAKPVAVRYAWAVSPLGNLKVQGKPWAPLASFRTDSWDFPESDDPTVSMVGKTENKETAEDAAKRLETRKLEEAKQALVILERLKKMGATEAGEK